MATTLAKLGNAVPRSHFETDCREICRRSARSYCDQCRCARCCLSCSLISMTIPPRMNTLIIANTTENFPDYLVVNAGFSGVAGKYNPG